MVCIYSYTGKCSFLICFLKCSDINLY